MVREKSGGVLLNSVGDGEQVESCGHPGLLRKDSKWDRRARPLTGRH